jgi:hypothetical protein
MQLALSGNNIPDDLREICERLNKHILLKKLKANWLWFCPFITSHVSIPENMSDEDILVILNDQYIQLRDFE